MNWSLIALFRIDFHTHSNYSTDSLMNVKKMIAVARKKGLSGIAITDHNTVRGGLKGIALNSSRDFMVVCGSEVDSEEGHIIGLFLNEEIQNSGALEIVDNIREQGGISVLAHPYKRKEKVSDELLRKIDCIEVFNSRISMQRNLRSYQVAKRFSYPVVAGSDAHFYNEIGNAVITINDDISDLDELRKIILQGEVKILGSVSTSLGRISSEGVRMLRTRVSDRIIKFSLECVYSLAKV